MSVQKQPISSKVTDFLSDFISGRFNGCIYGHAPSYNIAADVLYIAKQVEPSRGNEFTAMARKEQ